MPETPAHPMAFTMPGFAHLTNADLAELMTYIRNSWGNHARPVTEADIAGCGTRSRTNPSITRRRQDNEEDASLDGSCGRGAWCGGGGVATRPALDAAAPAGIAILDAHKSEVGRYVIPPDSDILAETNADQILYGKRLLADTKRLLPDHVGAQMNCNSCHMLDGKIDAANGYINTVNFYTRVMPRAAREVDLEGRINGCFQRSMNGNPLDRDGPEMQAMIAYMECPASLRHR